MIKQFRLNQIILTNAPEHQHLLLVVYILLLLLLLLLYTYSIFENILFH